jgi:hypothetical protein
MEYPNKGSLFPSTVRKSEKSPDFFGSIKVDRSYLRDLMDKHDEDLIEIKMSGWKRESKTGNRFLSLAVDTYVKPEGAPVPKSQEKDPWE